MHEIRSVISFNGTPPSDDGERGNGFNYFLLLQWEPNHGFAKRKLTNRLSKIYQ